MSSPIPYNNINFLGYHAPMEVYGELYKLSSDDTVHRLSADKEVNVCVGKEWHRFPSSFFLPSDKSVRIKITIN